MGVYGSLNASRVYEGINDTDADTHAFLHFHIEWSMTRMQAIESKSHSVVNDTDAFGQ